MATEIRPATQEEMFGLGEIVAYVYAGSFGDEADNVAVQTIRPEWTLCAFVDGVLASSFATLPMTMTTGGRTVDMGGVTAVGTLPEYRRRGLVRRIMTQALSDMRDRGQAVSGLWASQAAIYQRYGYSMVSHLRHYDLDIVDLRFFDGVAGTSEVQRVSADESFDVLQDLHTRFITPRVGYIARRRGTWRYNVLAPDAADGPLHIGLCREDGVATGYVAYTVRSGKGDHPGRSQHLKIRDMVALTGNATRSLWQFIASHDLVGRVTWESAPVDDPAPELMVEPRMLRAVDHEGLWLRIVDLAAALPARGYHSEGVLEFTVPEDELAPRNAGSFRLEVANGFAVIRRIDSEPSLVLPIKTLASLYTGFRSASELGAAGLVTGTPADLAAADAIFRTPHRPHCPDNF